jgi:2-C-methyl-D-erythritol 4-phosphate cytidylyltransferase/2-C-methyl-D-erythritol 2,4-cyclodiphosphate synthase
VGDAVVILVAAGRGERLGLDVPKAFVPLAGRPILEHAAMSALACPEVAFVVAVVPPGWEDEARGALQRIGPHAVVAGGPSRQESVGAALASDATSGDVLVCHDAARPFASPALFAAVVTSLADADGVVPVLPLIDTVKRVSGSAVVSTESRDVLANAQTPQAFRAEALRDAHARAERDAVELTDDAAALERAGYRVVTVPGEERNFKITTPADLERAEAIASELARG